MASSEDTQLNPEIREFKRARICIQNHICALVISQGDQESLSLRGPSKLLSRIDPILKGDLLNIELSGSLGERIGDAFTTSLSREKVEVDLIVRDLRELDLRGFVEGVVFGLVVDDLQLKFSGLGKLKIASLSAQRLRAILSGSPAVQISGEVDEQQVTVKGMGQYRAGNLETQKTEIMLSGSAFATVWAEKDLKVDMQGMGSIEYYGRPSIRRRTIGMNSLKPLGAR